MTNLDDSALQVSEHHFAYSHFRKHVIDFIPCGLLTNNYTLHFLHLVLRMRGSRFQRLTPAVIVEAEPDARVS